MKLKIFWTTYELIFAEAPRNDDDIRGYGIHDYNRREIVIDSTEEKEHQKISIIHELIHALENLCGFDLEEDTIRGLSHMLWTVFKENPALRKLVWGAK